MRGINQNLIIAIVTTGFLALSTSSGSAAVRAKAARFCAPGVCSLSQRCCVKYANDRPIGHVCVASNQDCPNPQ
jgi:hypothetical protein